MLENVAERSSVATKPGLGEEARIGGLGARTADANGQRAQNDRCARDNTENQGNLLHGKRGERGDHCRMARPVWLASTSNDWTVRRVTPHGLSHLTECHTWWGIGGLSPVNYPGINTRARI